MNLLSSSTRKSFRKYFAFLLINSALLSSCSTDDNENLGLDLGLPAYGYDTVIHKNLQVKTVKVGPSRTDNLDFLVLGTLTDSVMGVTKANVYSQVGVNGVVEIPKNAELDSFVLSLKFIGGYGNEDYPHNLSVYQLSEGLSTDSQYTNISSIPTGSLLAEKKNVRFPASRSVLSFRVDDLWNNTDLFLGKSYSSSNEFQEAFSGLGIQSETDADKNDGYLAYFSPSSAESGLVAHYHYFERNSQNELIRIDAKLTFSVSSGVKRFSEIQHVYESYPAKKWLASDSSNSVKGFVQAIGGTRVEIELPELYELAASGEIAVQKAELVLPCDCDLHNSIFTPLNFLDLKTKNPADAVVDVLDKGRFYWSRTYDGAKKAFVYNITSEVQFMLTQRRKSDDYVIQPLILQTIKNDPVAFSVGRYIVKGGSSVRNNGAELMVYYSKLSE